MIENFSKFVNLASPILITGESGTGKSHLARSLFEKSVIHRQCFLTAHLASLKDELIESELFGHKKGSFTGAHEARVGYLEAVGSGTLFLDEVGELSMSSQKKLLYLLEEKRFTRVGESKPCQFLGRLVLATNRDLSAMVERGEFREDLYYRLMLFECPLSPLRNDRSVLEKAIEKCFAEQKNRYQKNDLKLSSEVRQFFLNYSWPGNFRELKNCCEYAVVMSSGPEVNVADLPIWFLKNKEKMSLEDQVEGDDYHLALEQFEARFLRRKLEANKGRVNQTASLLGISKTALIYKSRKYGIDHLMMRAQLSARKDLIMAA